MSKYSLKTRRIPLKYTVLVVVLLSVLGLIGVSAAVRHFSGTAETQAVSQEAGAPEGVASGLVAGDNFEPGYSEVIYGSRTEAYLDGIEQRVKATKPSSSWKKAMTDPSCSATTTVCTAPAPTSLPASAVSEGTAADGGNAPGRLPGGMSVGAFVLLCMILAVFLWDDKGK